MKEMGNATMAPKAIQAHSEAASSVPLPPTSHNHAIPSNAHIWKGSSTVCVVAAALLAPFSTFFFFIFLFICVHQFGFCGLILHPTCYILRLSLSVVGAPPMIKYANCQPAPVCHAAHTEPPISSDACLPTRQYISSATLLNKFSCTALQRSKAGAPQYAMIFTHVQRVGVRWASLGRNAVGGSLNNLLTISGMDYEGRRGPTNGLPGPEVFSRLSYWNTTFKLFYLFYFLGNKFNYFIFLKCSKWLNSNVLQARKAWFKKIQLTLML